MIVENVPSDFLLQMETSVCTFSDDSRLIYLVSYKNGLLQITVYDIMYNKYLMLSSDSTITELLNQTEGFKFRDRNPSIQLVDQSKLLILFDDDFFKTSGNSALLFLVKLNFENQIFSIIDKIVYKDCYYSTLIKNESSFGLVHSFAINRHEYTYNQFLGYFPIQIDNENKICHRKKIVFDYDYFDRRVDNVHIYESKLWFLRDDGLGPFVPHSLFKPSEEASVVYRQLSYFDLNEPNPKEVKVELIDYTKLDDVYWVDDSFVYYDKDETEFVILNLKSGNWSTLKNNSILINYDNCINKMMTIFMNRCYDLDFAYKIYIDHNYNATFIDKSTKRLQRVPLKEPLKLSDILWPYALNFGVLDQKEKSTKKLPNDLCYSKVF